MAYIPLEHLLDKTDNSAYKLVILASKRALEIASGQPSLIDGVSPKKKPSTIALLEIKEGKVRLKNKL